MNRITKSSLQQTVQGGNDPRWRSEMSSDALHRPRHRPADLPGEGRQAAVALLILPAEDDKSTTSIESVSSNELISNIESLAIILTKRPENLRHHPGQISFPGGQREGLESLGETALREAHEEIGVAENDFEFVGQLNTVYIPPSDFTVTPFVGWLDHRPTFKLQVTEVDEVIEIPVSHLLDESNRKMTTVVSSRGKRDVPCFRYKSHDVWGATAIMLDDLLQRLARQDET